MRALAVGFLVVFLTPQTTTLENFFNFVIWNVGQGSWSTFFDSSICLHFDGGGETAPLKRIKKLCHRKENQIFLSHEDWDHIKFLPRFVRSVRNICLNFPGQKITRKALKTIPACLNPHPFVETIYSSSLEKTSNDRSNIYSLQNSVLFPGDASSRSELKWHKRAPRSLYLLLLSHHGSRTGTSKELLEWTTPKLAVSSSRFKRYRHPHSEVKLRLQKAGIPLLQTEKHGHLFFQLKIKRLAPQQREPKKI